MASPDYAALWAELRLRVEGDAEYARDEARRAGRRSHLDSDEYNRLTGEADALAHVLRAMDQMEAARWR
jgi:hypothetical protein